MTHHVEAMSDQEKDRVNVLLIDPEELPDGFWNLLGGKWIRTGEFYTPNPVFPMQRRADMPTSLSIAASRPNAALSDTIERKQNRRNTSPDEFRR